MDWKMFKEIFFHPTENSGENKNSFRMSIQYIYLSCSGAYLVKLLCEL